MRNISNNCCYVLGLNIFRCSNRQFQNTKLEHSLGDYD